MCCSTSLFFCVSYHIHMNRARTTQFPLPPRVASTHDGRSVSAGIGAYERALRPLAHVPESLAPTCHYVLAQQQRSHIRAYHHVPSFLSPTHTYPKHRRIESKTTTRFSACWCFVGIFFRARPAGFPVEREESPRDPSRVRIHTINISKLRAYCCACCV